MTSAAVRVSLSVGVLLSALLPILFNPLWSLNHSALWPVPVRVGLAASGLLLIWRGHFPRRRLKPDGKPSGSDGLAPIAVCLLLVSAAWFLFPVDTLLFGDGFEIPKRLLAGEPATPRSALYNLAVAAAWSPPADSLEAETKIPLAVRLLAWIPGILFLAIVAAWTARKSPPDYGSALLFMGGYLAIFQGYVESYALFAVTLAAYILVLAERPGWRRSAALVALSALAIGTHSLGVLVLPSTVFALVAGPGRRRRTTLLVVAGLATALAFVSRDRLPFAIRYLDPVTIAGHFSSEWSALTSKPWSGGILSPGHYLDILNGLLLAWAPAFLVTLALLTAPEGREALGRAFRTSIGFLALLFLLVRLLVATPLGPLRDWDLLCLFFLPAAFVVSDAWRRLDLAGRDRLRIPLAAAGCLLTLPWLLLLGDGHRATRRIETYISGEPAPLPYVAAQAQFALADQEVRGHRTAEAAAGFSRACDIYPRDLYARRAGTAWLESGDRKRALAEYSRAISLNPDDFVSIRQRAQLLVASEDQETPRRDFEKILSVYPGDGPALLGLALIARRRGDENLAQRLFREAIPPLTQATLGDNPSSRTRLNLATCLVGIGDIREATRILRDHVELFPDEAAAWHDLGICLRILGRLDDAEAALLRADQLQPNDPMITRSLAEFRRQRASRANQ